MGRLLGKKSLAINAGKASPVDSGIASGTSTKGLLPLISERVAPTIFATEAKKVDGKNPRVNDALKEIQNVILGLPEAGPSEFYRIDVKRVSEHKQPELMAEVVIP